MNFGNFNKYSEEVEGDDFFRNRLKQELNFLLPPCEEEYGNLFCQAVMWINVNGTGINKSYCPQKGRTSGYSEEVKKCIRIEPNIELPIERWSLIEFCHALNLKVRKNEQANKEFFTRLGGAFNRLFSLADKLRCRSCNKYMSPRLYSTKWKYSDSVWNFSNRFSVTTFKCNSKECSHKESVYLHFCWSCKKTIDSRDCPVSIGKKVLVNNYGTIEEKFQGYHLCLECGAGYRPTEATHQFERKYAILQGEICPKCTSCHKCGGQKFEIYKNTATGKILLKCANAKCGAYNYVDKNAMKKIEPILNPENGKEVGEKKQCQNPNCQYVVRIYYKNQKSDETYKPFEWADPPYIVSKKHHKEPEATKHDEDFKDAEYNENFEDDEEFDF